MKLSGKLIFMGQKIIPNYVLDWLSYIDCLLLNYSQAHIIFKKNKFAPKIVFLNI